MKKLVPVFLALVGVGIGGGVGFVLKPDPKADTAEVVECSAPHQSDLVEKISNKSDQDPNTEKEYVKLNNQFVVPIVQNEIVTSIILITLSVEVSVGSKDAVYAREPKLRDAFLQVMFDHANMGGFKGAFTNSTNLDVLRNTLSETGRGILGSSVSDVLILDIARQEVS